MDLLKLKKEEIRKVGFWTPDGGINITDPNAFYEHQVPNITLIVMTREVRSKIIYWIYFRKKVEDRVSL